MPTTVCYGPSLVEVTSLKNTYVHLACIRKSPHHVNNEHSRLLVAIPVKISSRFDRPGRGRCGKLVLVDQIVYHERRHLFRVDGQQTSSICAAVTRVWQWAALGGAPRSDVHAPRIPPGHRHHGTQHGHEFTLARVATHVPATSGHSASAH
jgi:hypothetical protein